jgi:uncharacterized membrane protein YtjA (UPF0391 family)
VAVCGLVRDSASVKSSIACVTGTRNFCAERTFSPLTKHQLLRRSAVLNLVVTLLIIALIAAVLGFGGIAMAAAGIAKIIFFIALLLLVIAALAGSLRGPVH